MGTTRYKISKDQLERVVENFVMEAASIESKKAPVKNHIPSQGAEAKKHIKNKITGKIVDTAEGVPTPEKAKKKLPQAADAKKHVSNAKGTHTNKAKVVKENEDLEEGWFGEFMGTKWPKKKAEEAYLNSYAKRANQYAEKLGIDVNTFKNAVVKFMEDNGGLAMLGGEGKNAEWDSESKNFKRLNTKGRSINPNG
jgi:hypothetical protein